MLTIRQYRAEELPVILQRGMQTATDQLVQRDLPAATPEGIAAQLLRMYQIALQTPQATILVADWPAGAPGEGPAAHSLLMPQANPFTGERELMVLDIYTHPALRGRQVGRLMLDRVGDYARSIGCGSIAAQVALHNQASLNIFRKSGFQMERIVVGRRC